MFKHEYKKKVFVFPLTFAAEIRTVCCVRSSEELAIQQYILWTWPSHRKRRWRSSVCMLKLEARSSTSVLVTLSCQEM